MQLKTATLCWVSSIDLLFMCMDLVFEGLQTTGGFKWG